MVIPKLPIENIRGDSKWGPLLKQAEKNKDKEAISHIIKMARSEWEGLHSTPRRVCIPYYFIGF